MGILKVENNYQCILDQDHAWCTTVEENIIATIKMRNNFCYPLKFFQNYDSNMGPFSIAPQFVIALNLFAYIVLWVL